MCCRGCLWGRGAERGRMWLEELSQNSSAGLRRRPGKMLSFNVYGNLWQTWKAVALFQLLVTDLKSDMRTGAVILEVSLLQPPWKIHPHSVKHLKTNCTLCIFIRCLLGHVHILLSSHCWSYNGTSFLGHEQESLPFPWPILQIFTATETTAMTYHHGLSSTEIKQQSPRHYFRKQLMKDGNMRTLPICFSALFLREWKPRNLRTNSSVKNMINAAEFRNYYNFVASSN